MRLDPGLMLHSGVKEKHIVHKPQTFWNFTNSALTIGGYCLCFYFVFIYNVLFFFKYKIHQFPVSKKDVITIFSSTGTLPGQKKVATCSDRSDISIG